MGMSSVQPDSVYVIFTLKMATAAFAETLEGLPQTTQLKTES
jgi:hypothetical protein